MRSFVVIVASAVLIVTAPRCILGQGGHDVIVGRVTSDSGVAISGAVVSATMADRTFQRATTDALGQFNIHFEHGTGDYLIHVAAEGYKPFRKRVTRAAGDSLFVGDVRLAPAVTKLATVMVQARKLVPRRGTDAASDVGTAAQQVGSLYAALAPDQEGDLGALANAIPGATARPDGLSVLGLAGEQSNVTLNGMVYSGASLPRDVQTRVQVITSAYDPARGGFSGAQTSVELDRGNNYALRRSHITTDVAFSPEQGENRSSVGQYLPGLQASMGGSGAFVENKWFYNGAIQLSQRAVQGIDLLGATDDRLILAGAAPDSIARFRQVLGTLGVPVARPGHTGLVSRQLSFITRLDRTPNDPRTHAPAKRTWNVMLYGNLDNDDVATLSPLMAPTRGGSRTKLFGGGQLTYSHFVGDILNETRTAFSISDDHGDPAVGMPSGVVTLESALPSGSQSIADVGFGGNTSLAYDRRTWTWETVNETQWYTKGHPHRVKLNLQSRLDGYNRSLMDGSLGEFTFPSLTALEAGQASSFSRTLQSPVSAGGEWSGFAALGDYWKVSPQLQLLYGARIEANRFTTELPGNAAVDDAFGVASSSTPNRVHVSPRLGFTWYPHGPAGGGFRMSSFAAQSLGPKFMIRGGIGEFRNLLAPSLLAEASALNGRMDGTSRITCIGNATPVPQWTQYVTGPVALPTTCLDGNSAALSDVAPDVRMFDRSFDAPRSWRANVAVTRAAGPVSLSLDATYSLNLNRASDTDLNFAGIPRFTLSAEGGRPVFVEPSAIVPATGLISTVDARLNGRFSHVLSTRSDLRSVSRRLTLSVAPSSFGRLIYGLAYTLADVREQSRGFDGTTGGSPFAIETGTGDLDVRHQLQASIGTTLPWDMTIALAGRISSGLPFTPRVAGDVNGDGLANDRAFLFAPDGPENDEVTAGMRSLLASAPASIRSCLIGQMGKIASRNSCRGPWQTHINLQLGLINRYGFTQRGLSATLNFINPLSGLDRLIHGPGNLRGWGESALPDPSLLVPRGFDPSTQRFQYVVNPRFGSPFIDPRFGRSSFRLSLDVRIDLGVPIMKQQAVKLLGPGRDGSGGPRLSAGSIASKLQTQVPDIYLAIMAESDSLLLSPSQIDRLQAARTTYRARIDSLWQTAGNELAAMGSEYDANLGMHLIDDVTARAWLATRDELSVLGSILTPVQMQLAPWVPALAKTLGKPTVDIRLLTF